MTLRPEPGAPSPTKSLFSMVPSLGSLEGIEDSDAVLVNLSDGQSFALGKASRKKLL